MVEVARPQVKTCHRNVPLSVVGVTTTAKKPSTTSFKMAGQTWVVGPQTEAADTGSAGSGHEL